MNKQILKYKILRILNEWDNIGYEGKFYGYDALKYAINNSIPKKEYKVCMKELKYEGLVNLCTLFDDDGHLHGSGYFITKKGIDILTCRKDLK